MWNILLFETNRGEKPVKQFIRKLSKPAIAKIIRTINLLEKYGTFLNMPHAKKIADNLYELRTRGTPDVRIFYMFKGKDIYLLHAFQKKSQKTPTNELKIALLRQRLLT